MDAYKECRKDISQEVPNINTYQVSSTLTIWILQSYARWCTVTYLINGAVTNVRDVGANWICGTYWVVYRYFTNGAPDPATHQSVYNRGEADEVVIEMADAGGTFDDAYYIVGCWFSYNDWWGTVNMWSSSKDPWTHCNQFFG